MVDGARQVDTDPAVVFLTSRQENPLRLRFNSRYDALAFAQEFGKRDREVFLKRWTPIFENYLRDWFEYVVDVAPASRERCPFPEAYKFNLVFSSIPFADIESSRPGKISEIRSVDYHVTVCGDAYDALMLVGAGQVEELVERRVSAFARIEILNERFEIGVNVLQTSLALKKEIFGSFPNGKVYPTRICPAEQDCTVTDRLIKRVLAVADDVIGLDPERVWERVLQLTVNDILFGGCIKVRPDGT